MAAMEPRPKILVLVPVLVLDCRGRANFVTYVVPVLVLDCRGRANFVTYFPRRSLVKATFCGKVRAGLAWG